MALARRSAVTRPRYATDQRTARSDSLPPTKLAEGSHENVIEDRKRVQAGRAALDEDFFRQVPARITPLMSCLLDECAAVAFVLSGLTSTHAQCSFDTRLHCC